MSDKDFRGWRFGGHLSPAQADQLEPAVDVMTEMLQQLLFLPPHWDMPKAQHEIALALVEHTGAGAGIINDISMLLVTEHNADEKLLQLNMKATQLRKMWIITAVLAIKAVINLDEQLKGADNDHQ